MVQYLLHHVQFDPLFAGGDAPKSRVLEKKKIFVRERLMAKIISPSADRPVPAEPAKGTIIGKRPIAIYVQLLANAMDSHRKFHARCLDLYTLSIYLIRPKAPCQ
jgi:hypothetical protein